MRFARKVTAMSALAKTHAFGDNTIMRAAVRVAAGMTLALLSPHPSSASLTVAHSSRFAVQSQWISRSESGLLACRVYACSTTASDCTDIPAPAGEGWG
jgi:hypothetical protein